MTCPASASNPVSGGRCFASRQPQVPLPRLLVVHQDRRLRMPLCALLGDVLTRTASPRPLPLPLLSPTLDGALTTCHCLFSSPGHAGLRRRWVTFRPPLTACEERLMVPQVLRRYAFSMVFSSIDSRRSAFNEGRYIPGSPCETQRWSWGDEPRRSPMTGVVPPSRHRRKSHSSRPECFSALMKRHVSVIPARCIRACKEIYRAGRVGFRCARDA